MTVVNLIWIATMSPEEIVIDIQNKLLRMINENFNQRQAKDLIKMLYQIPITPDLLTRTGVAYTVNRLRKLCQNKKLAKISKSLVKRWQRELSENESPWQDNEGNQNPRKETGGRINYSQQITPSILASSTSSPSPTNVHF